MNILKLNVRLTCFEKQFFSFFSTNPSCNIQCFHSVGLLSPLLLPGFPVALVAKNPPVNVVDIGDMGSIPGSGRSPGGGHGNPVQCSCLKTLA